MGRPAVEEVEGEIMRRVKVFKLQRNDAVPPKIERVEDGDAIFHEWGTISPWKGGSDSSAIIERRDGTIENIHANLVQFVLTNHFFEINERVEAKALLCDHGKGPSDYCEPCGRVNGGG